MGGRGRWAATITMGATMTAAIGTKGNTFTEAITTSTRDMVTAQVLVPAPVPAPVLVLVPALGVTGTERILTRGLWH